MKRNLIFTATMIAAGMLAFTGILNAQSRFSIRLNIGDQDPALGIAYSQYDNGYAYPSGEIREMYDAGVCEADVPIILYIYDHSQYSLRQIYSLRLRGASWMQLSMWCGVPLEPYFGYRHPFRYDSYYDRGPDRHIIWRYDGERDDHEYRKDHGRHRGWDRGEREDREDH